MNIAKKSLRLTGVPFMSAITALKRVPKTRSGFFAMLATSVLLLPASLLATPVTGTFGFAGGGANVSATSLVFLCSAAIDRASPCPSATAGNFIVTQGTGDFAAYVTQGGFIESLMTPAAPINLAFSMPDFITFSSEPVNPVLPPDIALDLEFIFAGINGQVDCLAVAAVGQQCTPTNPAFVNPGNPLGLSQYNLQNTQTGSSASFSVSGNARRISTGELSDFTGIFTANFSTSYQELLKATSGGGAIVTPYSASFNVTLIPEPGSSALMMIGIGLGLLARFGRSRKA